MKKKMGIKFVNKNCIIAFACFLSFNSFSQSRDTIYFLINKKDTLIKKHSPIKEEPYYLIYFTEKESVVKNNTPNIETKVWVADMKYDYYAYERQYYEFNFFKDNSKLISKKELNSLNYIRNREDFLKEKPLLCDCYIFFIEQLNNDSYIVHEMYPIIYE